jgi:hypothetical protein
VALALVVWLGIVTFTVRTPHGTVQIEVEGVPLDKEEESRAAFFLAAIPSREVRSLSIPGWAWV